MRIPQTPPKLNDLMAEVKQPERMIQLISLMQEAKTQRRYLHWDKLRRLSPPTGVNHREWWMVQKLSRMDALKPIPLKDTKQQPFQFAVTEMVLEELHQIDLGCGGAGEHPGTDHQSANARSVSGEFADGGGDHVQPAWKAR
jgi:hypothetical protein